MPSYRKTLCSKLQFLILKQYQMLKLECMSLTSYKYRGYIAHIEQYYNKNIDLHDQNRYVDPFYLDRTHNMHDKLLIHESDVSHLMKNRIQHMDQWEMDRLVQYQLIQPWEKT